MVFICTSRMTVDVKRLFTCVLAICCTKCCQLGRLKWLILFDMNPSSVKNVLKSK